MGQKNLITRRWARRGTRPRAPHDQRTKWAYIFGALSPKLGNPPPPGRPWSGRGRPTSRMVRDPDHQPQSAEDVALSLAPDSWETVFWREGSADILSSRFARVRVRAAHRDYNRSAPRDEEWLLLEWPSDAEKPSKFWLATVPEDIAFDRLVALAKLRWRIERDTQELKQELGLGHFEGRAGGGSITTPPYASRSTPSSSPNGRGFPPQNRRVSARRLQFPRVRPGARPPVRPERHVVNSIATMRRHLIVGLVRKLERCPCCATPMRPRPRL